MALIEDPKFKVYVEKYAADKDLFFADFAKAFGKLIDLNVNRNENGLAPLVKGGCPFIANRGAVNNMAQAKL